MFEVRRQLRTIAIAAAIVVPAAIMGCAPNTAERAAPHRPATIRPPIPSASPGTAVDGDGIRHDGILVPAGKALVWRMTSPVLGRLRFGWSAKHDGPVTLRIAHGARSDTVERSFAADGSGFFWEDLPIAEDAPGSIRFEASPGAEIVVSDLRIVTPSDDNHAVIVILFDTLRRDAVGLYGATRPTTPHLDRILAGGWKAERAYALASWTIPSCATLFTGMDPEVNEDDSGAPIGIAPDIPTIGEDFSRAGWSTAQFNANPTLNEDNGFARGFSTFYTPPFVAASMSLPGDETMRRIPSWLQAHAGEKFLLYVQLIEPHEPYGPPDRPKGTTPFDPGYAGPYTGAESHYALSFDTSITPRDIAHLHALYEDDVRYADMLVGRFWDGLDPALRARSTVVFLSDHGEEFFEHGGWKHGPSLYDEVLRVPLVIRPGKGIAPPSASPGSLVSLADVLPTVAHLAGVPLGRPVDGTDLFDPSVTHRTELPSIHMLTGGAARAVTVTDGEKLFFFDRFGTKGIPDAAADPQGHRVAMHLREFMPSFCRFDLRSDPRETTRLSPFGPRLGSEWRSIEESIAHTRRGIEIRVVDGDAPSHLAFDVALPSSEVEPFALEPDDRVAPNESGTRFTLALTPGDVDGALFHVEGDAKVTIRPAGDGCASVNGTALGNDPVTVDIRPAIPRFELDPRCASIFVWRSTGERHFRTPEEADEARKNLRAIGYIH